MGKEKFMAENNNLGVLQEKIEHISDVLDSLRSQGSLNSDVIEKILTNISLKLEAVSSEESADLIKVFVSELKKNLEDKHSFISSKFEEIETSFENLAKSSDEVVKVDEMRQIFDIIAMNLGTFSTEVNSQKELLSDLVNQVDEFKKDDSDKKDILKNISVLKVELEKFNNGFQSIILNLNDNFKQVSQEIINIDQTEALSAVKKDIENIFLSSTAVLSALQVIDKKTVEFEEFINSLITKEDFQLEREQIAKLIEQNSQMIEYVDKLPVQKQMQELHESVVSTVGVINALKTVLSDTNKQNHDLLTAQLDSLEKKILNISTEEEFIGFRKELQEFAQEVIQSTNLMRADLADTNLELQNLAKFLSSMEIKETFETFANLTKVSEKNVKDSINKASSELSKEIEQSSNFTKANLVENVSSIVEKIELAKSEITDNSKSNLTNILEYIQSVINNLFTVKSSLELNSEEKTEAIGEKIEELKENVAATGNYIVQNSKENLDNIIANVDKVFNEVELVKDSLGETSIAQTKNFGNGINEISRKIKEIKEELNQNSQENFANIVSIVDDFSQKISELKDSVGESSEQNSQQLKDFLDELSSSFSSLSSELAENTQESTLEMKNLLNGLLSTIQSNRALIEQNSEVKFSEIKGNFSQLLQNLENFQSIFESKSQANYETISSRLQSLGEEIEEEKAELQSGLEDNFSELRQVIDSIPQAIKEDQEIFEEEKRLLLEQNSKNIEDLGEKVQNLIEGILSKDNPFKAEVSENLSNLKMLLAELSQALGSTDAKIEENMKGNLSKIESSISHFKENYENSLNVLQSRLVEYLNLIKNTTVSSELRLEDSAKEIVEIKAEIQAILESISILNADGKITDLSTNINQKFEEVLKNIYLFEEKSSLNNQENIQKILGFTEEQLEKVLVQLQEYGVASKENSEAITENLVERISALREQISLANTDVLNIMEDKFDQIALGFEPLKEGLQELLSIDFDRMVNDVKSEINLLQLNLNSSVKGILEEENAEFLTKLSENFDNLEESLDHAKTELIAKGANNLSELKDILSSLSQGVEHIIRASEDLDFNEVVSKITDVEANLCQNLQDLKADIRSDFNEGFIDNSVLVKSAIEELSLVKNDLIEEINGINNFIKEENSNQIINLKEELSSLIEEVNKAQEGVSSYKLDIAELLKIQDEEVKSQLSAVEGVIVEELSQNISTFKEAISAVSAQIDEKITISEKNYQSSLSTLLSEIKSGFEKNVEENLDDLKSFIEVLENRNDYTLLIDNLKSDLFEKFSILADDVEEAVASVNVKEDISELSQKIHYSVSDLMDNLYDKILIAIEDDKDIQSVLEKTQEITKRIEDLKNIVTDDVAEKMEQFSLSLEKQSQDFSNLISEIRVSISDLKQDYSALNSKSTFEISNQLKSVEEKLNGLDAKLDNYNFSDLIEDSKNNLSEQFEVLNQKLDAFVLTSDTVSYEAELQEIKDSIDSQSELLENLKSLEKLDKLSKIDGVIVIQAEIKKILSNFESKLASISTKQPQSIPEASDVKLELESVKKEVIETLLNIFEQISFVVEAEDIKDFVEEKSEEIKSSLGNNFNNILSHLNDLKNQTGDVDGNCRDIKKEIGEVKKHLQLMQNFVDEEDYSYTLQDVESDIAKVRLILDEITKTRPEFGFDKLNDDILSISTRTNKLLLNSDESYNVLKDNLDEFKTIVYNLDEKIDYLDKSDTTANIEQKLEDVNNHILSCVQSDKTFNQAFMYLAEWVDTASENMNSIIEKFDVISEKIEAQQERIEQLEGKIDKISGKKPQSEIKSVVEEVLSQMGLAGGKEDTKLAKKVDSIEKQLAKLGKNIEKLTSYVDED